MPSLRVNIAGAIGTVANGWILERQNHIDKKADLMELKDIALDYMLNIGKELEEYYRNALMENLKP